MGKDKQLGLAEDSEFNIEVATDEGTTITEEGHRDIYSGIIRRTERVLRCQIELEDAESSLSVWKTTQLSPQYFRLGPAARDILHEERRNFAQAEADTRKQFKHAMSNLTELPEFSTLLSNLSAKVDPKELLRYRGEMKEWSGALRQLLIDAESKFDVNDPSKWSWDQITISLDIMDELSGKLVEELYTENYTNINGSELEENDPTRKTNQRRDNPETVTYRVDVVALGELKRRFRRLSPEELAAWKAILLRIISRNKVELDQLCVKQRRMESLKAKTQIQFLKYSQWEIEDRELIKELSQRLQLLKTLQPCPLSTPPPRALVENFLKVITDDMELLKVQLTEQFTGLCIRNCNETFEGLRQEAGPLLELTKRITERALQLMKD